MRRSSTWTAAAAAFEGLWPATATVVDVGGDDGRFLHDLLGRRRDRDGVLLEQEKTADRAHRRFAEAGLEGRIEIVRGRFFDSLPAGADRYVLGHVLHDWPDPDSTAIPRRVREAMVTSGTDARVVIVDQVLDGLRRTPIQSRTDLLMRVLFGSRERTRDEWRTLANEAGFEVAAIPSMESGRSSCSDPRHDTAHGLPTETRRHPRRPARSDAALAHRGSRRSAGALIERSRRAAARVTRVASGNAPGYGPEHAT